MCRDLEIRGYEWRCLVVFGDVLDVLEMCVDVCRCV